MATSTRTGTGGNTPKERRDTPVVVHVANLDTGERRTYELTQGQANKLINVFSDLRHSDQRFVVEVRDGE